MIPPKNSAAFVWRMEEVLDLYEEPYDPLLPVVCFDERPCQLLAEVREPLPIGPGRPERRDHEYERRGMVHVSMAFEPLTGWRRTSVTERRRGREFAEEVRRLLEEDYPQAERVRLVLDNLSTHTVATQWRPSRRPSRRSKPASWLGESSSSTRRCTDRG